MWGRYHHMSVMRAHSELMDLLLAQLSATTGQAVQNLSHEEQSDLVNYLGETLASAEARWQKVRVPRERFVAYLVDRLPTDPPAELLLLTLQTMQTDDLYLACGCAEADAAALAEFEAEFVPVATLALRGMDKSGTLTDEAIQLLRERLFLGANGRAKKITQYLGHGKLSSWVRATAVRIALDQLRVAKREKLHHVNEKVLDAISGDNDPELAHLKKLYGSELKSAFGEVLRAQAPRDRTLLRYHYVDGLNIEQIGLIFQVHKTTTFRWLEAARSVLVPQTRKLLKQRLGLEQSALESVMRLIQSQLDLSIHRFLKTESLGTEPNEP
jgi:RNA polymerase sigma-70 factor (ECF subfamily)